MEHYAGIDVSLEQSSVCVVDATGRIVREAKVASEPEALIRFFGQLGVVVTRIGLEAGPLSQWLHAGLTKAGLRGRAARDPAGEGGAVGDGGEDRPQGRARHRPAAADGLVPAGALQVAAGPGGPGAAGRAQALAGQAFGHRAEHPGHLARLRAEGRHGEQGPVRGPHPRARDRPGDAGTGDRADAAGPRGVAHRVSRAAPGRCWASFARTRSAGG